MGIILIFKFNCIERCCQVDNLSDAGCSLVSPTPRTPGDIEIIGRARFFRGKINWLSSSWLKKSRSFTSRWLNSRKLFVYTNFTCAILLHPPCFKVASWIIVNRFDLFEYVWAVPSNEDYWLFLGLQYGNVKVILKLLFLLYTQDDACLYVGPVPYLRVMEPWAKYILPTPRRLDLFILSRKRETFVPCVLISCIYSKYLEPRNDPGCDWKRGWFGGLNFQNRGHVGSRYIYIYISYIHQHS